MCFSPQRPAQSALDIHYTPTLIHQNYGFPPIPGIAAFCSKRVAHCNFFHASEIASVGKRY